MTDDERRTITNADPARVVEPVVCAFDALSVSYALAVTQFQELLGDDPSHAIILGVVILVAVVLLVATAQTE